ncbi:hypothetical protein HPB47_013182 [Ixodes persulcatus]|uniref:Uncharacterized protein n=1 Tax=Ixodes persulcatus TaxID=34615 RepID=A0AC60NRG5_IXOPE|nr:hypothetical protein HPB47_013182 [Ixodes persulcatus]
MDSRAAIFSPGPRSERASEPRAPDGEAPLPSFPPNGEAEAGLLRKRTTTTTRTTTRCRRARRALTSLVARGSRDVPVGLDGCRPPFRNPVVPPSFLPPSAAVLWRPARSARSRAHRSASQGPGCRAMARRVSPE